MTEGPTWPGWLLDWELHAGAMVALALAAVVYGRGRRSVRAGRRAEAAFWAGWVAAVVAVVSPVGAYAHDLLSVHMVQHLLLTMVAAPLLVVGHPGARLRAGLPHLAQEAVAAASRWRLTRVLTRPLVGWCVFAATGWAIHFSTLFDLALRHQGVHALEHGLFLGTALLFWWPLAGGTVTGRRPLAHGLRVVAVVLAMPQNTFLALAIHSATSPLYDAYVEAGRTWGPSVLADQRQAAGIMWVAGDLVLLLAVLVAAAAWARDEALHPTEDDLVAAGPVS